MKKIVYGIFVILSLYVVFFHHNKIDEVVIPDEAIRFRVIANSNLPADQKVKTKVKVAMEETLANVLENAKDIEDARMIIKENLPVFDNVIKYSLKDENEVYSIDYGYHLFPEKTYQNKTYQEGYYESLVVTLGKGEGDNFWCVLFPPLCFMDELPNEEVEYKSFLGEFFSKLFSK